MRKLFAGPRGPSTKCGLVRDLGAVRSALRGVHPTRCDVLPARCSIGVRPSRLTCPLPRATSLSVERPRERDSLRGTRTARLIQAAALAEPVTIPGLPGEEGTP